MEQRKRLRLPVDHPDHHSAVLLLRRRNVGKQQLWLRLRQLQKQRLLLLRAGKHGGGGAVCAPAPFYNRYDRSLPRQQALDKLPCLLVDILRGTHGPASGAVDHPPAAEAGHMAGIVPALAEIVLIPLVDVG